MNDALLLVNMGGPARTTEVREYLRAIFHDPAILPLPGLVRKPLANLISARRAAHVAERYQLIGGGSPLLHWTRRQQERLTEALRDAGDERPVHIAFRYTSPLLAEAMRELNGSGIRRVTLLPLFPHYTHAMTGSVVREALRAAMPLGIEIGVTGAWGNSPAVLELWQEYLRTAMNEAGNGARVLFVAHGIPQRSVERGEDYPHRVADTARALASSLPRQTAWSLCFQSKVGPVAWTKPYLEEELPRLCATPEPIVLMPLSFAADCLETLYDLDIVAAQEARQAGVTCVVRVPAFNDDPRFARALLTLVKEESHAR